MIYAGTKICGVEATMGVDTDIQRFVNRDVVYQITGSLPGLSDAAVDAAWRELTAHISSRCGAKFFSTKDRPQTPNIVVTFGSIDGSGRVLAWSELRRSESWRVTQKYDTSEAWVRASNPAPTQISYGLVALHETLHALGYGHIQGGVAVLNPIYNPSVQTLQPLDIAALVSGYGEPTGDEPEPRPLGETLLGRLFVDENGFLKLRK